MILDPSLLKWHVDDGFFDGLVRHRRLSLRSCKGLLRWIQCQLHGRFRASSSNLRGRHLTTHYNMACIMIIVSNNNTQHHPLLPCCCCSCPSPSCPQSPAVVPVVAVLAPAAAPAAASAAVPTVTASSHNYAFAFIFRVLFSLLIKCFFRVFFVCLFQLSCARQEHWVDLPLEAFNNSD